ncbi:MAG: heme ABC exporter ATP-binding protein CcmA [Oligoflexales bacterium]
MLVVQDLSFSYRQRPIFSHVQFQLPLGSMMRIEGPNGCGKSTLLSICAGLRAPGSGRVFWQEQRQSQEIEPIPKSSLQYLPAEANGLFQKLTAMENLLFWSKFSRVEVSQCQIEEALKKWGFRQKLVQTELPVAYFSTGMKRRLAFAKLSLLSTDLWILDEPLYGLDEQGVKDFSVMVAKHVENQGAVLFVSHDLQGLKNLSVETVELKRWKHA